MIFSLDSRSYIIVVCYLVCDDKELLTLYIYYHCLLNSVPLDRRTGRRGWVGGRVGGLIGGLIGGMGRRMGRLALNFIKLYKAAARSRAA